MISTRFLQSRGWYPSRKQALYSLLNRPGASKYALFTKTKSMLSSLGAFLLLEENIADSISVSSNSGHSQLVSEYGIIGDGDIGDGGIGGGSIGGGDTGDGDIGDGGIGGGGLGNNICKNAMYFFSNSDACC